MCKNSKISYPKMSQAVDVEKSPDLFLRGLQKGFARHNPRIVHQHRDVTHLLLDLLRHFINCNAIRDVTSVILLHYCIFILFIALSSVIQCKKLRS